MRFGQGLIAAVALSAGLAGGSAVAAPVNGTGNVYPDVIFGSGNANGSFTGVTVGNLELALRGKIRKAGVYGYDGDHTYTFDPATYGPQNGGTYSAYNFEWSINTDVSGSGGATIGSYDYLLQVDTDPTVATAFLSADPYDGALHPDGYFDHSFGDNSTGKNAGVEATDVSEYLLYLGLNVSQQSWNMKFGYLADVAQQGLYTIVMSVLEKGTQDIVASTSIDIKYGAIPAVPVPAALPMALSALAGFGGISMLRRRRNRAV